MERPKNRRSNKRSPNLNSLVDRKIKSALFKNIEVKQWTQIKTSTAVDYDGVVYDLSLVPQGDTHGTRDGDRLHITYIRFSIDVYANVLPSIIRVVIFQWFGTDVPTPSVVLLTVAQAEAVHSPHETDSFPRNDPNGRGRVLADHLLQCDSNGTVPLGTAPRTWVTEITNGFRPNMQFTTGTTGGTNHIYIMLCSDRKTTNVPLFRFYGELEFTDA